MKRFDVAVGVLFLIVGIAATVNTIRLNNYIAETMPRDVAQEQCNVATLEVLKSWTLGRIRRDNAMNSRDDAMIVVLDRVIAGEEPSVEDLRKWRNAVALDRHVRAEDAESRPELPRCEVGVGGKG